MKLGMQVGLGPGHIVLDGDPAPSPLKGHSPPPHIVLVDYFCQLSMKGAQQPPLVAVHVCCGYGRPSPLLLSSC